MLDKRPGPERVECAGRKSRARSTPDARRPSAASSGSSNKPKPAAAMTRGRAEHGAICHKKPSGVKLCRMATATDVVNGAIIVAPPIAPATDSATAFCIQAFGRPIASRANQRQHRARAEFHWRANFRRRRAEHDAGSGRHDHRQQRRDRRQIGKAQSASEAPVDIAQFAQHMRQTEQRQRRRIGGERRHRRESRERKDRRHAERDRGADIHQRTRLHDGAWRARRINAAAERALADRAAPACPTASRTLPVAGAAEEAVRGGGIDLAATISARAAPAPVASASPTIEKAKRRLLIMGRPNVTRDRRQSS